jgi:arylformamidase
MSPDYETEYNNRARVPEHPAIITGWARDAAAYRAARPFEGGISYGEGDRQRYDFFPATGEGPVALFIHGGYWQALDRSFFSHMAAGPNMRGLAVAVMEYDLCPHVPLARIVEQTRMAILHLWRKTGKKVIPFGHSAGGHLTAMALAVDWKALDPSAPGDLTPAGLSISGLFDLPPLVGTSINIALGLTVEEARRLSPAIHTPPAGRRLVAAVGGAESAEYLRQGRDICRLWHAHGVETTCLEIEGANHFTVIAGLADRDSELTDRLVSLSAA